MVSICRPRPSYQRIIARQGKFSTIWIHTFESKLPRTAVMRSASPFSSFATWAGA